MPIEQLTRRGLFTKPAQRVTEAVSGAGVITAAATRIARAEEGEVMGGASAKATLTPERDFLDVYPLPWVDNNDGKSFNRSVRLENPQEGLNGWVANYGVLREIPQRNTRFEEIIDIETGEIKRRTLTVAQYLEEKLNRYNIPNLFVKEHPLVGTREFHSLFKNPGPGNRTFAYDGTPLPSREHTFLFYEFVVRPEEHPDAMLIYYRFADTTRKLNKEGQTTLYKGIGSNLAHLMFEFQETPESTVWYVRKPATAEDIEKGVLSHEMGSLIVPFTLAPSCPILAPEDSQTV